MKKIFDKCVCSKCAGTSLGRYIDLYGEKDICDYCGKDFNPIMTIDVILPRLFKSWTLYYSNFEDSYFPDDFRTPYYLSDIVNDEDSELYDAKPEFINDLCQLPDDHTWQKDSEYWSSFSNAMKSSWELFSKIVKTKWRYTYFLCGNDELDPAMYSPLEVMRKVCELIQTDNSLIYELPARTSLYRTRFSDDKFKICAKELGSAPPEYSESNRFSPKGISMFYGSFDKEICKIEAANNNRKNSITCKFLNTNPLKILDLTNIPSIPKLYDENFNLIPALTFLHYFSKEISKPANEDELNYIPTQVFTEFIRFQNLNIKGVKYNSSKKKNGKNIVLFYKNDECKDEDDGSDCLVLDGII